MIDEFNNNFPIAIKEMIILRQKEYARRDYEGLNEEQKIVLEKKRGEIAKRLNTERNTINKNYRERNYQSWANPIYNDKDRQKRNLEKSTKLRNEDYSKALKSAEMEALKAKTEIKSSTPKPNPTTTPKQKEVAEGFIKRNWNKLGTGGKIATVAIPTAAAIGTSIAVRNKNKKED